MPGPATLLAMLLVLFAARASAADGLFPRPAALQPAIAFWTRVYTEIDSAAGFVHDSRHLDRVYGILRFDPASRRRNQGRVIEQRLEGYREAMRALADGKREDLNALEQSVLREWGEEVSPETLKAAVGNLRFQRGQSDHFRGGLIRAGAWEAAIRQTLQDLGLPETLAVLPHVESSYNPLIHSRVGAAGLWQFTRFTGRRYLRVDHVVDERLDPLKSTEAAARLLEHNYSVLKSWPLAITAYNHGLAGVRRAVRTTGSRDIATIVQRYNGRRFGFASRNFYAAFLAAMDVAASPGQYFGVLRRNSPDSHPVVEVPAFLSVTVLSRQLAVDETTLRKLNRPLQDAVWQGRKYVPRGYLLRLPRASANGNPAGLLQRVAIAEGHDRQLPDLTYTVERGDTLSDIARHYRTSVRELMAMNDIHSRHRIRAGQTLRLPVVGTSGPDSDIALAINGSDAAATPLATPDAGPQVPDAAAETVATADVVEEAVFPANTPPGESRPQLAADPGDYEVSGDDSIEIQVTETLGHYAEWLETRSDRLRRLNGLRSKQPLRVGHRLKLDLAGTTRGVFEKRRLEYHRENQSEYFRRHRISGACSHTIRTGDSLWIIAARDYRIPLWLLRQYNPDVDFDDVLPPGATVMIPLVEAVDDDDTDTEMPSGVNAGACAVLPVT